MKPPKHDQICDKCGQKLQRRKDDYPEAIKKRLQTYNQQTKPAIDYLQNYVKVIKVDASGRIRDVYKEIIKKLK